MPSDVELNKTSNAVGGERRLAPVPRFTLRPETAEDEEFVYALFASTRADEMALTDWSDQQKEQFLRMQHAAQRNSYAMQFPEAERSIIVRDGVAIGRVFVDRTPSEVHVVDIILAPHSRNLGIGSALVTELMEEAATGGKKVRLYVERFNPALRWYQRLGFAVLEESEIYLEMTWQAGATAARS